MDALLFFAALVGLAVVAPRWGYDSTDGVDSEQYRLRASWLAERRAPATSIRLQRGKPHIMWRAWWPRSGASSRETVAPQTATPAALS
jgi:hypothetical protein